MSVIVKGMEMPTCCARCELAHDLCWCMAIMGDDGHFYDSQYGADGFDIQKARLPKCPLVEIPKRGHGEWIDYVSGANWATCSACGKSNKILKRWKYCPECGVEMKGIKEKTWK